MAGGWPTRLPVHRDIRRRVTLAAPAQEQ